MRGRDTLSGVRRAPSRNSEGPPLRDESLTLAEAVRSAYETSQLTQTQVEQRIKARRNELGLPIDDNPITQSKISKYARGESVPTLDAIREIELACGQDLGFILRAAGYVSNKLIPSVQTAISYDPRLTVENRSVMLTLYESLAEQSARRSK
jgi:transcriptional regulator with XRE-family HTH domain